MNTNKTHDVPLRLEGVREQFERWRRTHRPRSRIPAALWAAAVRVAVAYGIHRASRALRLDYYSLKERVEQQSIAAVTLSAPTAAKQRERRAAATTFLELPVSATAGGCECTLELEDARGAKMRVHVKGAQAPDLAAISRGFWNPSS